LIPFIHEAVYIETVFIMSVDRDYIGIELNPEFVELARDRIKSEQA
jgi:hypothetical protein